MNGLFITGTDTGVGKTVLGALLLAGLRQRGMEAALMKPVQTGCKECSPDLDYALSMASMEISAEDYANMSPYRFKPLCSPHLAAELSGIRIDRTVMVEAMGRLRTNYEFIIAEGAGGVAVPFNRSETMLHLMRAFGFPVLLAARPGLGTINHTLLSIRALRSDGLIPAGVVFVVSCNRAAPDFIEKDNGAAIEQFGRIPVLGIIPYCAQLKASRPCYADLSDSVIAAVEKIIGRLSL